MTEEKTQSSFSTILENGNQSITRIKELQNQKITATKRNIAFGVVCIGGFFAFSMIAMQVITGIIALGFSLIASVGLYYGYRYVKTADPLIRNKMRNKVLEKMIEEAKTQKIETLTQLVLSSNSRLNGASQAVAKMTGLLKKLEAKVDKDSSLYDRQMEMVDSATKAVKTMTANYHKAKKAHEDLEVKVNEYKSMHEFSNVFTDMMQFVKETDGSKLEEMLGYEAFNQIETDFHDAIAEIEVLDMKLAE